MTRALAMALLLACAAAPAQELDGPALLAQLEQRLLAARRVAIEATIESTGAIPASLKGRGELRERNRATVTFAGSFAGRAADLALLADGRIARLKNGAQVRTEPVGREANRAVLLGLTRMGLLHNLARLTSLSGADHGHGGVEQWVSLDGFRPTTFAQGGELAGLMSFGFDVMVAGAPSASARLWIDPATGLPRRRQQTVRFPQGEMTVIENYTRFEVE